MGANGETSYLPSFIRPLGPLWVLLMGLQRCIIYATASDTSVVDQNQCCVSFPVRLSILCINFRHTVMGEQF